MDLRDTIARAVKLHDKKLGRWTVKELAAEYARPITQAERDTADRILAIPELAEALARAKIFSEGLQDGSLSVKPPNLGHSIRVRDPD